MPSLERSTELLTAGSAIDGLAEIARALGFGDALTLDNEARRKLAIPEETEIAKVARGDGDLRALMLILGRDTDPREAIQKLTLGLSRQSAELLWMIIAGTGEHVAVACWSARKSRPRVVSLLCNRTRITDSDAETVSSLASAVRGCDVLTYARWLDILGREAITRRFFRALSTTVETMGGLVPLARAERRELALVCLSRLIFLSFLESKGWLDGDYGFLENGYTRCIAAGGEYHRKVLDPLFFGTLNTRVHDRAPRARSFGRIPFLNGGLFARSTLEKRHRDFAFTDEALGDAFGSLLSRYRFTPREDSAGWSEASIDPEVLGKAFEALMASDDRKGSGAFYTPQELVEHVTEQALARAIANGEDLDRVRALRVLDPACGSGAFLVYALERLTSLRLQLGETGSVGEVRRRVLASSIFGVDLNPMAVWLCELRLWLSVVVESPERNPMRVPPLPNLDRHIKVGDSLTGGGFSWNDARLSGRKLERVRSRYMRASGARKRTLAASLDRCERAAALNALTRAHERVRGRRREILLQLRTRDLFGGRSTSAAQRATAIEVRRQLRSLSSRIRALRRGAALPFSYEAHFSDAAAAGGFDVVLGNPPWVRLHRIAPALRSALRREFTVYREAAWRSGADLAGAGHGFAAQVDMASLFVERSLALLSNRGVCALLVPAKLWRSLAGGGTRKLISERSELLALEDYAAAASVFDAAAYPSLVVFGRKAPAAAHESPATEARFAVSSPKNVIRWRAPAAALRFDASSGAPWLLVPPEVRAAFDRIGEHGIPLARSIFGRPTLGVKTGFNEAFLVSVRTVRDGIATISGSGRTAEIEAALLRPVVRGETLSATHEARTGECIIWTHDNEGRPLASLPPLARRWLGNYRQRLAARSDLHGNACWWSVFRVESARSEKPRVIWADMGRRPRAIVVRGGDNLVPLNTCYAVECPTLLDADALTLLLNSDVAASWLDVIAEPARGGYRRFLGWTMSLLPIPRDWSVARDLIAGGASGATAYGLEPSRVEALLAWTGHSS